MFFTYGHLRSLHKILNDLSFLRLLVTCRTAFCILLNICLPLSSTTTDVILSLRPFEFQPRTSITILLQYIISKPGCCLLPACVVGHILRFFLLPSAGDFLPSSSPSPKVLSFFCLCQQFLHQVW